MVGLRSSTLALLGVALGLLVAGALSFARDGIFAFLYASFGGIVLLGSLLVVMADIGRTMVEAAT